MFKEEKEPEFLRKERLKLSKALTTKIVLSKKSYNRKKHNDTERTD